jgi:hypothetical protein
LRVVTGAELVRTAYGHTLWPTTWSSCSAPARRSPARAKRSPVSGARGSVGGPGSASGPASAACVPCQRTGPMGARLGRWDCRGEGSKPRHWCQPADCCRGWCALAACSSLASARLGGASQHVFDHRSCPRSA